MARSERLRLCPLPLLPASLPSVGWLLTSMSIESLRGSGSRHACPLRVSSGARPDGTRLPRVSTLPFTPRRAPLRGLCGPGGQKAQIPLPAQVHQPPLAGRKQSGPGGCPPQQRGDWRPEAARLCLSSRGQQPLGSSRGAIRKDLWIVPETLEIQISGSNLPILK